MKRGRIGSSDITLVVDSVKTCLWKIRMNQGPQSARSRLGPIPLIGVSMMMRVRRHVKVPRFESILTSLVEPATTSHVVVRNHQLPAAGSLRYRHWTTSRKNSAERRVGVSTHQRKRPRKT